MLQKEKSSEWDGSADRVNRLIVLAERELSAFFAAVNKNFGAEQASKSANDWLEELEVMDWPQRYKALHHALHATFPFLTTGSLLACIDFIRPAAEAPSSERP